MSPDYLEISAHNIGEASSTLLMNGFYFEEFLLVLFAGLGTIALLSQLVPGVLLFVAIIRSIRSCTRSDMGTSVEGIE